MKTFSQRIAFMPDFVDLTAVIEGGDVRERRLGKDVTEKAKNRL
jgi:hypothetical protein